MSGWTDDRIDLLKKLWNEGLSASLVAAEIGGVSRNAVIGKVHRLGLEVRRTIRMRPAQRKTKSGLPWRSNITRAVPADRPACSFGGLPEPDDLWPGEKHYQPRAHSKHKPATKKEPLVIMPPDPAARCSLMDLDDNPAMPSKCRWPIGGTGKPDFFFCGGPTSPEKPYCPYHCDKAFVKPRRITGGKPPESHKRRPAAGGGLFLSG